MLRKPDAKIIIDGLKERGFIKSLVLSEIEQDIAHYLEDDSEAKDINIATV